MSADKDKDKEKEKDPAFEDLLDYLKKSRAFDFTDYKRASLIRRVHKRMNEVGIEGFDAYQDYLEVHPQEFTDLFNTILINVTSFFRDPEAWDYLTKEIMPQILDAKTRGSTVRIWSAGCSTGEEAYSLAIVLAEALGLEACRRQVKIYATDVDEEDLEAARRGSYSADAADAVPEPLRKKYFESVNNNGRCMFRHDLRRILIFGRHDLMHDAPISRLDLLLCRNTLIYFNREAQERIVARFHFALKDSGFLFLGRAETMLSHADLFEPADMKHRVFRKVAYDLPQKRMETMMRAGEDIRVEEVDINFYLPGMIFETSPTACLAVDHQGTLALANEKARSRLGLDPRELGRPFQDLELSYRPVELRSLIDRARDERQLIAVKDVEHALLSRDGQDYLDVTVIPLWGGGSRWLGAAITFDDATERHDLTGELEQARHDLETTYEELQSTNEELETSNEELQSTVEELQTTNEELQSSNEEMETMNEELQSTNVELQSINDELRRRTQDLDQTNDFLQSILTSVSMGVVVIDREFDILLWNERAEDLWGLRASEVKGQSLLDLDIGLPVSKLKEPVERFLAGEGTKGEKVVLDAVNRRGQAIKCYVTQTARRDFGGEPAGVILLMEEERR